MARKLRPEERELWKRVVETATPMRPASVDVTAPFLMPGSIKLRPSLLAPKIMAFKIGAKAPSKPAATHMGSAAKPQLTMDAKSFGKLTRGKLQPEARLDLHGMTMSEAHPMLQKFILGSAQLQRRLVLVITGKGKSKPDQGPIPERHGVLRHNVPLWLRQAPLSSVILEVTSAHQRHGGGGAFYVYLRRKR
ncbi:MAG: Smr/MutS family protein [Rhodobacterales bacterium]